MSVDGVIKNHLKVGQDVSKNFIDHLKNENEKEIALNKAMNYLSRMQKTQKEVFDYLTQKGFEEEIVNYALDKMKEYKYINDEAYAKNFVKYKTSNSGKRKILFELKKKGIDEETAKMQISQYSKDKDNIINVAKKYLKNKELDFKTKQKTFQFLASRGYEIENINSCLNFLFKGNGIDDDWE